MARPVVSPEPSGRTKPHAVGQAGQPPGVMGTPAGDLTMNGKNLTYWITTLLVGGFMTFAAISYLSHDPKVMGAFASLGYPAYFPIFLGLAKVLGVVALLIPGTPLLKEWAYAGFTFTFVGAIYSHMASNQPNAVLLPALSLLVLAISYASRPAERRLSPESEAEVQQHLDPGLPAR